MLNTPWHHRHTAFFNESLALLQRCEQCIEHLEMIRADEDAIDCLRACLCALADKAVHASQHTIAGFARALLQLDALNAASALSTDALGTLKRCLSLLAWQCELIDPHTGELPLDEDEQQHLLERLAHLTRTATSSG